MFSSVELLGLIPFGLRRCSRMVAGLSLGWLYGCSFQGFQYLENGSSNAAGNGTSAGASGGSDNQGGRSYGEGGTSTDVGTTTGDFDTGGSLATGGTVATGGHIATGGHAARGGSSSAGATLGDAATNEVIPTQISDTDYRLTMTACNVVMDVNPQVGARVTNLTMDSTNIIAPCECLSGGSASNTSGSTFWTSPQKGWPTIWPPVAAVDGDPYTPDISGNHLIATGSADPSLGASVTKDFSADDGTCWVTLIYTITATKAITVAPWEITRVPHGGIAFFPLGDSDKLVPGPLLAYVTTDTTTLPNMVWFDDTAKTASNAGGSKLIADGEDGWLAYALDGNLFIKQFPDTLSGSCAPGEGDVEIYADATAGFLQLEAQGAYSALAQGESLSWTVRWRVVPIPSNVTIARGDASLLEFAQQQLAL